MSRNVTCKYYYARCCHFFGLISSFSTRNSSNREECDNSRKAPLSLIFCTGIGTLSIVRTWWKLLVWKLLYVARLEERGGRRLTLEARLRAEEGCRVERIMKSSQELQLGTLRGASFEGLFKNGHWASRLDMELSSGNVRLRRGG